MADVKFVLGNVQEYQVKAGALVMSITDGAVGIVVGGEYDEYNVVLLEERGNLKELELGFFNNVDVEELLESYTLIVPSEKVNIEVTVGED